MKTKLSGTCKRDHQTVVFIQYPSGKVPPEYWERVVRFAGSFNHEQTIKADIRVVIQSTSDFCYISPAKPSQITKVFSPYASDQPLDYNALQQWARAQGYNLVVFATLPGADMLTGNKG